MSIQSVSLDAAGTLIAVAEPVGETYARLAGRHGIEVTAEELGAGFRRVYPSMPPLAFHGLAGAALARAERGWWRQLVAAVFERAATGARFDDFFDEVYDHYAAASAWRVFDEVEDVLAALRGRGLRLVVTSNFDTRLHGILDGLALRARVDAVVCSAEAGAAKPDARVFHAACGAVGSRPAAVLHVGDDRRADLEGAVAAGLRGLLVVRARGRGHAPADASIEDLRGVLAAVERG